MCRGGIGQADRGELGERPLFFWWRAAYRKFQSSYFSRADGSFMVDLHRIGVISAICPVVSGRRKSCCCTRDCETTESRRLSSIPAHGSVRWA